MKMSVDRDEYDSLVKKLVSSHHSKVVSREKGECIIKYLKGETNDGSNMRYNSPKFRFYVRNKGFEVLKTDIAGIGVEEYLFQKNVEHRGRRYKTKSEPVSYRRVAFMEDFYDILKQYHNHDDLTNKSNSPIGYKRCLKMIQETYSLIPRSCVQIFCNLCTICKKSRTDFQEHKYSGIQIKTETAESFNSGYHLNTENENSETEPTSELSSNTEVAFFSNPETTKEKTSTEVSDASSNITDVILYENRISPVKPSVITQAKSFMEICQLEMIEMDDMDQNYLYVGHFIDVYTNYHILFPLVNKSTAAIVQGLGITVFSYFGIPKTLQSTLGPSFLTPIIEKIHSDWLNRGNCHLGNIFSNKSASNMLMHCTESEIKEIFKTLASENMVNDRHIPWVKWIPLVQYRLNTQVQELSDPTAYQKVVKQLPRSISICDIHTERGISQVNSPPEILETVVNVPLSSIGKDTSHISIAAGDIVEIASNGIAETEIAVVTEG